MSDSTVPFGRVGILGLGVMGGSLARALSALDHGPVVVGWSPDGGEVAGALEGGALHEGAADPVAASRGADLLVLATPLSACLSLLAELVPHLSQNQVVTDVASLKAPLAAAAAALGLRDRWVGAHPMCGSAASGFDASRPDLFVDAKVWLCAHPEAAARLPDIRRFWVALGAVTAPVDPWAHDSLMSRVSHLPQLTANALAATLEDAGVSAEQLGPGARDVTRLAESSPEMWRDILAHAPAELPGHLRSAAARLVEIADLVGKGDTDALARLMAESRAWRRGT